MDITEIKKIIESIEQINHSGSGRVAGVSAEAANIRMKGDYVLADVTIKGPREGQIREFKDLEYNYKLLSRH